MTWEIWALIMTGRGSEQGCWGDMHVELGRAHLGQAAGVGPGLALSLPL